MDSRVDAGAHPAVRSGHLGQVARLEATEAAAHPYETNHIQSPIGGSASCVGLDQLHESPPEVNLTSKTQ